MISLPSVFEVIAASSSMPCSFLMDAHTLRQQFRHVVSLASLAYIFSCIHAIQYSLLDHDMDDNSTSNQETSHSDFTSTHDTSYPADTSSNSGKANTTGRWTDQEITLLLDYIEAHCPLSTSRGLSLKKTQFNKARDTVKSKDASQCHYKWGHVRISHCLGFKFISLISYESFVGFSRPFLFGIRSPAVDGMMTMVSTHGLRLRGRF